MERYIIDMDDEGSSIYYLTEDASIFQRFVDAEDDDEVWQLLEHYKKELGEPQYDLKGITVLDIFQGYFY
jgi:hypothetical protein